MLTDIETQIDYYTNLARLAAEDDEHLTAILAVLDDIRQSVRELVEATERLQATTRGEQ